MSTQDQDVSTPDRNPRGRVALITGASRGLGRAIALALGRAGVRLALVGRDRAALDETAAQARHLGTESELFEVDVRNEDQVRQLATDVVNRFGAADILVNNAGINIRKTALEFTLAEWNSILETNLTGAFLICRSFVPLMRGRGYGRVINLTSIMSHVSLPGRSAYSASKAGLLGFTRALALELAPDNISVVAISPGPFATEMNRPLIDDPVKNAEFLSNIPLRQWGRVEDIGELALFLCSDHGRFLTGSDVLIDGGWCAR